MLAMLQDPYLSFKGTQRYDNLYYVKSAVKDPKVVGPFAFLNLWALQDCKITPLHFPWNHPYWIVGLLAYFHFPSTDEYFSVWGQIFKQKSLQSFTSTVISWRYLTLHQSWNYIKYGKFSLIWSDELYDTLRWSQTRHLYYAAVKL